MSKQPGIYDISNEEYHAPIGISRSGIMTFLKSPLHYWDKYINPNPPSSESTPEKEFGSATHTYLLEPHEFKNRYLIIDKVNRTTKEGKDYWAGCQNIKGNRSIIYKDDYQKILEIYNSVRENSIAFQLIDGAEYEKSIYWIDEETSLLCKARPDILHDNMVSDIKTALSADLYSFQFAIRDYGYHIQCAMMQDAIKYTLNKIIEDFIFIVIEKKRPFATAIYHLSQEAIQEGRKIYKQALLDIKECHEKNEWRSYPIQEVSIPYITK